MIEEIQMCSPAEVKQQVAYLQATPVAGIAAQLQSGMLRLNKGIIRSLETLGALKTEFGTIGSEVAPPMEGERKFRIREVLPILRANPSLDQPMLRKVEEFIEKDARGEIDYNVTILRRGADVIVKNGNKRTIALYEGRKGIVDHINFPVFLVEERRHGT